MENDKNISIGDSCIDVNEKEVVQLTNDILDGKLQMEITTKSLPKTLVKLTTKKLEKYSKNTSSF